MGYQIVQLNTLRDYGFFYCIIIFFNNGVGNLASESYAGKRNNFAHQF